MASDSGRVVLVTGDAPYLGGPATWARLREAAPEFEFIEVDLMEIAFEERLRDAARSRIESALRGARAIIAHGTAAPIAIEAVSATDPAIPILLLSPRIVMRPSPLLAAIQTIFSGKGADILNAFARSKHRRLLKNDAYVRKQLALLVRNDLITEELLNDAKARIADPGMEAIVSRSAESLRALLTPIDEHANTAVSKRMVLLGEGPMDRKARFRGGATVLEGAWAAPMIEAPQAVADTLRALISRSPSRTAEDLTR